MDDGALEQLGYDEAASGLFAILPDYGQYGNATCAVLLSRPGFHSETLMLCCQHVLSPELQLDGDPPLENIELYNVAAMREAETLKEMTAGVIPHDLQSIGFSTAYGGTMRRSPSTSFDAQLARIGSLTDLRRALNGLRLSSRTPAIENAEAYNVARATNDFEILVSPDNPRADVSEIGNRRPVRAEHSDYVGPGDPLDYKQRRDTLHISHLLLIELRIRDGRRTYEGDSGSPVVMQAPDGRHTLIGMHIAGGCRNGEYYSFVLPAWQLFDSENYPNLPEGAQLTPLDVS